MNKINSTKEEVISLRKDFKLINYCLEKVNAYFKKLMKRRNQINVRTIGRILEFLIVKYNSEK